ncbi:MAG TPA: hypothetical protein VOA80_14265 [Thermoanaerobaculia bacterium]|nr:hypothetical protein [Thermoanaerobaculia bacterium]
MTSEAGPRQEAQPPGPIRRRDRRTAVLVALAALLVYNLNGRVIASSDTRATRFVPFALLEAGTLRLDPMLDVARTSRHVYWALPARGGGYASLFPVVAPLLVTPLYVPAAILLARQGWPREGLAAASSFMEKLAASCVAAVAAGLMYLLLRRRMRPPRALGLTVAFALGTETWMIGSQALWQHGTEELLLIVALLALTGPLSAARLALGGAACGLAIAGRPIDALLVAPFALLAPAWAGRRAAWFFLGAAVPLALVLAYNLDTFGLVGGGYQLFVMKGRRYFEQPMARGLVEMLFSPDKGLFFYTPFLLFLPVYLRRALAGNTAGPEASPPGTMPGTAEEPPGTDAERPRTAADRTDIAAERPGPGLGLPGASSGGAEWLAAARSDRTLTAFLLAGIIAQLVVYSRSDWRGGTCYGPRYLADLLPLATWMLAPVVESLAALPLVLFRWAVVFSIAVQAVGAFCYPRGASDLRIEAEHSRLPAYLIEAPAGIVTPGWVEWLGGR